MFRQHLSFAIDIEAPPEKLWRILTDFDDYAAWNRFTPYVACNGIVGDPVSLLARLGRGRTRRVELRLIRWEAERELCWGTSGRLVGSERSQRLVPLRNGRSRYVTTERFEGPAVPLVIVPLRSRLMRGYRWVAQGLKERAEAAQENRVRQ